MLREAARVAGLSLRVSEGGLKAVISQFQSRPTYQVTGAMQDLRLGSSVEKETHILFFFFYTHLESRALVTVFARAHTQTLRRARRVHACWLSHPLWAPRTIFSWE